SNTAVRVAVTAGAGPAVLSRLTIQAQLAAGQLVHIPLQAPAITRPLTAIWVGPHRPVGPATELLRIATHMPCTANDSGYRSFRMQCGCSAPCLLSVLPRRGRDDPERDSS